MPSKIRNTLSAATAIAALSACATIDSRPIIPDDQAVREIVLVHGAFTDVIDQAARGVSRRAARFN